MERGERLNGRLSRNDYIAMLVIALIGVLVFLPGLEAGLVSEDFDFFRSAHNADVHYLVNLFVPNNYTWYRPLNDLGFWLEVRTFDLNPAAFHSVSLIGHIATTSLLYVIARRLGCRRVAAFVTGLVFVTTVHAQEVVWWWSDSHHAFAGPFIVGSLLASFNRRRALAIALAVLALLTDESAILILPLTIVGDLLTRLDLSEIRTGIGRIARSSIPLMIVTAAYLVARLAIGRGIASESKPCHSVSCITAGLVNYGSRLVIRPDRAYVVYDHYKAAFVVLGGAVVFGLVVVAVTRWRRRRPIALAFGAAWTTLTVAFFVLALWPYASDRFMYYPDIGLALMLGGCAEEILHSASTGTRWARLLAPAAAVVVLLWIGAGIRVLEVRASGWVRAGNQASLILDHIHAAVPNPPPDLLLEIDGVPDTSQPAFPPGNTGPYVFRNGLEGAIRLRFKSEDIWVAWSGHPALAAHSNALHLRINGDNSVNVLTG